MKTNLTVILILLLVGNSFGQDPFELYKQKDKTWRASIFELYAEQYADIDISKEMIDLWDLSTIEEEIKIYPHEETEDFDKAMQAIVNGNKVFFFIDNYVWGGLVEGSVMSGSWQRKMPLCSGFYPTQEKCFQNEGINYHCGKKEKSHPTHFIIIKKKFQK